MTDEGLLLILVVLAVLFAILSAILADEKGYSGAIGLLGLFFGPIGLMFAMGLPDKKARPTQKVSLPPKSGQESK